MMYDGDKLLCALDARKKELLAERSKQFELLNRYSSTKKFDKLAAESINSYLIEKHIDLLDIVKRFVEDSAL